MTKQLLVITLLSTSLLVGCNNSLQPLNLEGTTNNSSSAVDSTPVVENSSVAHKMVMDLEASLRGLEGAETSSGNQKLTLGSLGLSETQIQTIIASVQAALASGNLSSSNDLKAIIPTLLQGASLGVGALQLPNVSSVSDLLSLIGNSTLNSLVNNSQSSVSTALLETVAKSLFANLNLAGVQSGGVSSVASTVINSLIGNLGSKDLATSGLSLVISSLAKGAILGIGNLGLPGILGSTVLSGILNNLGSGSQLGIANLVASIGAGSSSSFIKSLVDAFTNGSNSALGTIVNSGSTKSTLKTLLASLLTGLGNSASSSSGASTGSSLVSTVVTTLVSSLLSNLFK